MWTRKIRFALFAAALAALTAVPPAAAQQKGRAAAPKSLRLYILDCGKVTGVGESGFGFQPWQLATTEMFTPCYLIAHPKGTLMWDTGEIPDSNFKAPGPATQGAFTVTRPLLPQLAAIGYTPADITYLALSHYHGDHVANANAFAGSTWIVQKIKLKVIPGFDFNKEQTAKSREMIETFVKNARAQLWIQHDAVAKARMKISPEYYE